MKNLTTLLISTLFIATFGFGQTDVNGVSSLTYSTDCELADPDDNPIEIKGFGEGEVNAQQNSIYVIVCSVLIS